MQLKRVMRYDRSNLKLRLFCLIWQRGDWGQKDASGRYIPYSFKLTFGLRPALFSFRRELDQVRVTALGLAVNYHWSCGGRFC